ncbi:MAG: hypothetical protein R3E01_27900 [Pirellulaceae bacterium]|nr:hypothetical protein [Planctomycetales bacterium]
MQQYTGQFGLVIALTMIGVWNGVSWGASAPKPLPLFPGAEEIEMKPQEVRLVDGKVKLKVQLNMPKGWKINEAMGPEYQITALTEGGVIGRKEIGERVKVEKKESTFAVELPATSGEDFVQIAVNYYYCQKGENGICKASSVVWKVPLTVGADVEAKELKLAYDAKP